MIVIRWIGVLATVVVVVVALHVQVRRHELNLLKHRLEQETTRAVSMENQARIHIARDIVQLVEPHLGDFPPDVDLYMIAAANYRLVADFETAEQTYRRALRIGRRPEIYLNLGDVLLQQGRTDEALESYAIAVAFSTAYYDRVPLMRDRVRQMSHEVSATGEP